MDCMNSVLCTVQIHCFMDCINFGLHRLQIQCFMLSVNWLIYCLCKLAVDIVCHGEYMPCFVFMILPMSQVYFVLVYLKRVTDNS